MELGFVGRRRCFEEARRYAFALAYGPGAITLVDAALGGGGIPINCGDLPLELFSKLSSALPGAHIGVDLGAAKNGLVMVWRGHPLLHAVVPADTLRRILASVSGIAEVAVGASPYVDPSPIFEELSRLCGSVKVKLVDERRASLGRYWLWRKYPELSEDEVDALSFVLSPGIALDICRQPL